MDCPRCGSSGQPVAFGTVKSLALSPVEPSTYYLCLSNSCSVAYFSSTGTIISTSAIRVPVWSKTSDPTTPVCYCAQLTRQEIVDAVHQGCETIEEIRQYTGKTHTGDCRTENPIGRCCHSAFQVVIEQAKSGKV